MGCTKDQVLLLQKISTQYNLYGDVTNEGITLTDHTISPSAALQNPSSSSLLVRSLSSSHTPSPRRDLSGTMPQNWVLSRFEGGNLWLALPLQTLAIAVVQVFHDSYI